MKRELSSFLLSALCLVLAPAALASTTWYVNGLNGSDSNDCTSAATACKSIGHAISLASSGDSLRVAPATYKENLTINFSLKIMGYGAKTTIIDGGGVNTVVTINNYYSNTQVTLTGLTIQNGFGYSAGGIRSAGAVTINNSSIRGNTARAGIFTGTAAGAGIFNDEGALVINNSTISGNTADGVKAASGAGIYNFTYTKQASLRLNNSTISGNNAFSKSPSGSGGAIAGGSLSINNSTISGNSAPYAGGISTVATVEIQNNIVANNSHGNCAGTFTSKGYNLSSDGTCNFSGPGDMNNTDPLLGPLQNNGGPTQTMALLPGSPAIDAGNPNGCTDDQGHLLKSDQRGKPRPDSEETGGCDIGAFEKQSD